MLWALGLMIPSVAMLVAAQVFASLALIIAATVLCGVSAGLGYRSGLQVVNQIAPPDRRAEVVSSFFICCFIGNAVPVIGVGVITAYSNMTLVIAIFAVVAFIFGVRSAK